MTRTQAVGIMLKKYAIACEQHDTHKAHIARLAVERLTRKPFNNHSRHGD